MEIWKFQLEAIDHQQIPVSADSTPLCVKLGDNHAPQLWVLVDPNKDWNTPLDVWVYGTGMAFDSEGLKHLDTFILDTGLVFHVFVNAD